MTSTHASVLVVEDEPGIRKGLCDLLQHAGYHVEFSENGEDGYWAALSRRFDLVLLDIMLPGMNGFEVCQRIREKEPILPIIILTAKGAEEDILKGFDAGADDYVTKPFSIKELLARVKSRLR